MSSIYDFSKNKSKSSAGITSGTKAQYDRMYFGKVVDNADVQRMGRLRVYISELGGDPLNDTTWITVAYASPFAGATNPWKEMGEDLYQRNQQNRTDTIARRKGSTKDSNTFEGTQQSYGFWMIPPDLNAEVVVGFANADPSKGFWFGCIYQQYMNHMVPGIAANRSYQSENGQGVVPVSEYNRFVTDPSTADPSIRPDYTPLHSGLKRQGLLRDTLRGISSSSARREAPSEVFGILTPRGSHFVMDDNTENEFIRFRTRSGTQILISETFGHIYMITRDGRSWLELHNNGYVDIYGETSVSVHAVENINLHADEHINMHAGGNINIKAGQHAKVEAGGDFDLLSNGTVRQSSGADTHISSGGNYYESAPNIYMNTEAADVAKSVQTFDLDRNASVKSSAAPRVPEAEPWQPHSMFDGPTPIADPVAASGGIYVAEAEATGVTRQEAEDKIKEKLANVGPPPGACVDNASLTLSEQGKLLILHFEAFVPFQYWDRSGWSIGYGHHLGSGNFSAEGLTEEEAYDLFSVKVKEYENGVKSAVTACLTQAQFDALVCFLYNLGAGTIRAKANLRNAINQQRHKDVYLEMKTFINVNRQPNKGLAARREMEANLYLTGNYPSMRSRETNRKAGISYCKAYPNVGRIWGRTNDIQNVQAKNAYKRMTGKDLI